MKKTEKKIENTISTILTPFCEDKLKQIPDFLFVTHTVNYKSFPSSLIIQLNFSSLEASNKAKEQFPRELLSEWLTPYFLKQGLSIKSLKNNILYKF